MKIKNQQKAQNKVLVEEIDRHRNIQGKERQNKEMGKFYIELNSNSAAKHENNADS